MIVIGNGDQEKAISPINVYYFELSGGCLRYYASRDRSQEAIGELVFSGYKVVVKNVYNSETILPGVSTDCILLLERQKTKLIHGRQKTSGKVYRHLLAAYSAENRELWKDTIVSWQRNYWHEAPDVGDKTLNQLEEYYDTQRATLLARLPKPTIKTGWKSSWF